VRNKNPDALDEYTDRALARFWNAQHFSYRMITCSTRRLTPTTSTYDARSANSLTSSLPAGSSYLAESYTGWPN
jgi:p-hydroxybenzoate 3-monooxygenase